MILSTFLTDSWAAEYPNDEVSIQSAERSRLFDLIEKSTSLFVFQEFLKSKRVPHSAGKWKEVFESRVVPAMAQGKITRPDLIGVLRDVEEYGRQHVFLYQTTEDEAAQIANSSHIRSKLRSLGRLDLIDEPPVLDRPNQLTLSDVRIEQVQNGNRLVIKGVEGRQYRQFIEEERHGTRIIRTYEMIDERAVNVVRLHPSAVLEMRIQTKTTSDYSAEIEKFWSLINPIIPRLRFQKFSVSPAKQFLWKRRGSLQRKIRYSDSRLRNSEGTVLSAATGSIQASLYDDNDAAASLDTFLRGDALCDKSNVFWLKQDNGTPTRDTHILLDGQINEFVVTATCTKADYGYVLNEILQANS